MHKHGKKDSNHNECMKAASEIGASVFDTSSMGDGFPDFVAGFRNKNFLFEVKRPKAKPTDAEYKFYRNWNGQYNIVSVPGEVRKILLYG
jgi:hypothetical protein